MWSYSCRGAIAGIASLFALLCLTFLNPIFFINAHAADEVELPIDVNITPQLALATDTDTVEMQVNAEPNGVFTSAGIAAHVSTNNATGYTLDMASKGNDSNLVNIQNSSRYLTSSFSGSVTSVTMPNNSWGFSLDNTNYSAVPLSDDAAVIKYNPSPVDHDIIPIYYGAKVDNNTPKGVYVDTVTFTVYINSDAIPDNVRTIFDITYMQDMNSLVCENTATPNANATEITQVKIIDNTKIPRTTLIDSRDGTTYLVSKLADGNCWMSQNLEFETDTEPLFNTTTDLTTIQSTTMENATKEYNDYSYNGANWYTDYSVKPSDDNKYYRGGTTAASTPSGAGSAYNWERAGVYYNFYSAAAATVNAGATETEDTICPFGWTLPTEIEWNTMLSTYGINNLSQATADPVNIPGAGAVNNMIDQNRQYYDTGSAAHYWLKDSQATVANGYVNNSGMWVMVGASIRCIAK